MVNLNQLMVYDLIEGKVALRFLVLHHLEIWLNVQINVGRYYLWLPITNTCEKVMHRISQRGTIRLWMAT